VSRVKEVGMQKRIVFALVTACVLLVPAGIASAGQNDVIREVRAPTRATGR
jgi:hypothetical protein